MLVMKFTDEQELRIGPDVVLKVHLKDVIVDGEYETQVKFCIHAPDDVTILREELVKQRELCSSVVEDE